MATLVVVPRVRALAQYQYLLGLAGIGLLALPLLPVGVEINGARIWVSFGRVNFSRGVREDRIGPLLRGLSRGRG